MVGSTRAGEPTLGFRRWTKGVGLGPWPEVWEEGPRASVSSSASRKGDGGSEELSLSLPRLNVAELPKGIGVSRGDFPKEEKVDV